MAKPQLKQTRKNSSGVTSPTTAANEDTFAAEPLKLTQPELSSGDLGTLQQILFGKQIEAQSKQLVSLQSHLEDQLARLQDNCAQQFQELRMSIDEGFRDINRQVDTNEKNNAKSFGDTHSALGAAQATLKSQITTASTAHGKQQAQLEMRLDKTSDRMSRSIKATHDEIVQKLEAAVAELDTNKLDKNALSSMLGNVATQLTGQEDS